MGRQRGSQYSHGQILGVTVQPWAVLGVTVQPWADNRGHSTAMGRQRGSQYNHGQTEGGHSTANGRQRGSQHSHGQTKGVIIQLWADRRES